MSSYGKPAVPKKELSLFDSTNLIVGIIIGVGIYQMAPDIARGAGSGWGVLLIWIIGGLLSLCGALGYAELASAYPRTGGDYIYLSRAYGSWAGFLFGWVQLLIVRPGDIAAMAFAFATYAHILYNPSADTELADGYKLYACAAIAAMTIINILGVREGKFTQNILTIIKVLALLAIVAVVLFSSRSSPVVQPVESFPTRVALILVLFAFGGWNEMVYVAAEVKNPARNIVRALVLGTVAVTVLYLLLNIAFLYTLGYAGLANSQAVASESISAVFPHIGGRIIALLICLSALGVVNGQIFTGARITYALGVDYRLFSLLGKWNPKTGTPVPALLAQAIIAMTLVILLGSFLKAVIYTAVAVYSFYLATTLAILVLRRKDPGLKRPYKVTGYPFTPLIFAGVCIFLIYSAVTYKPLIAAIPLGILLLGMPVYWLTSGEKTSQVKNKLD